MKTTTNLITFVILATLTITAGCSKDDAQEVKEQTMTFTLGDMPSNTEIEIRLNAVLGDRKNVWIDFNNNGKKDEGENNLEFGELGYNAFKPSSSTITIYGKVTHLWCHSNFYITSLDVKKNPSLVFLNCATNSIKGEAMTNLVKSLPLHEASEYAQIIVIDTEDPQGESNVCTKADVKIAKERNWSVFDWGHEGLNQTPYEGS